MTAVSAPSPRHRWPPAQRALAVTTAVSGVLAGVALLSLWVAPPPQELLWFVVWQVLAGIGFAVSAREVLRAGRPSATGGWLLTAAVLLLLGVPLRAAGLGLASTLGVTVAFCVAVPLAVLHVVVPSRGRAVLRTVDASIVVLGTTCAIAVAVGARPLVIATAVGVGVAAVCAGWVQFELTAGDERRQVLWVVVGVCSSGTSALLFWFLATDRPASGGDLVLALALVPVWSLLPLTVATAVLAPRRVDVRVVISRAMVVVVMLTLTVAVFTGTESAVAALSGRQLPAPGRALLAAAIAAGFHPAMVAVGAALEEMLYGGRTDAMGTLTMLTTELSAGSPPQEWLDTLRVALGVPSVVLTEHGQVLAASPRSAGAGGDSAVDGDGADRTASSRTESTSLMVASEHVGDLLVGIPDEQLRLAPATHLVLSLLAAPLAQALHAIRLGEQVRSSRGQVVAALEEERRRVRRDLHDGLGPTLTGIAYTAEAASNLVVTDAERARTLLQELRTDAADAIVEIRRIVYGLRPRALDELGLVGAVRQRLAHGRAADGRPVELEVVAPEVMPDLPAAVEVAAYRIAVEAVTNVARHAGVAAAHVAFAVTEQRVLTVTVRDRGHRAGSWPPGVGLGSMRERAEEVGGSLTVEHGPAGALVTASLPLDGPAGP